MTISDAWHNIQPFISAISGVYLASYAIYDARERVSHVALDISKSASHEKKVLYNFIYLIAMCALFIVLLRYLFNIGYEDSYLYVLAVAVMSVCIWAFCGAEVDPAPENHRPKGNWRKLFTAVFALGAIIAGVIEVKEAFEGIKDKTDPATVSTATSNTDKPALIAPH